MKSKKGPSKDRRRKRPEIKNKGIPDFRDLFDKIPAACFLFDEEARVYRANAAGAALLGYGKRETEKKQFVDFIDPGDRETFKDHYDLVLSSSREHTCEFRVMKKSGQRGLLLWHSTPMTDDAGNVTGIFGSAVDITERTEMERRQKLTIELINLLNRQTAETDTIRDILFLVKEATGFEAVAIRLKAGEDYPYYVTLGFPPVFVEAENYLCSTDDSGKVIRDTEGKPYLECMCGNIICGRVDPKYSFFTEGGSFWTNSTSVLLATTTEADRQARTRNRCHGEGYESVALVPLRSNTDIIGLMQLNDSRKNMFSSDMIEFYEGIGAAIGVALARIQAENEIRKNQKNLAEAQRIANLGSWEWDPIDNVVIGSEELYKVFGFDGAQYGDNLYDAFFKCVDPADAERIQKVLKKAIDEKESFEIEYSFIRPDGVTRYLQTQGEVVTAPDGRSVKMIGLTQDITERKLARDALHRAQADLERRVEERTAELAQSNERLRTEINERMQIEARMKRAAAQLQHEQQTLEKKNIALREILNHISDEKDALRRQIVVNVEESIMPRILRMKESLDPVSRQIVEILERDLKEITSPFLDTIKSKYARLSPRELEVCRLVKHGYTSKEIAQALHISEQTVAKQRKMIRKKLGIASDNINLATFLETIG